jgi:hypothetical protein
VRAYRTNLGVRRLLQPRVCSPEEVSPCKASWPTHHRPPTSGRDRSEMPAATVAEQTAPFQQLDFLYTPSRDVAADLAYLSEVLGGRVVFAIEAMGTRVAAIQLTEGQPLLLLADHLEGERPILVYRVADLPIAMADLEGRGWERQRTLEIPHGPCCSFRTPGGHRVALYQLTRPEVATHFTGRRDF